MEALSLGKVYNNIYDACKNARILLVLNNHKKYATVINEPSLRYENNGFEILDAWAACTELYYCDDIRISTLGNMNN